VATGNSSEQRAQVSHVGQNEYGLCLLATRDLDAGVVVARFEGEVVTFDDIPDDEMPFVLNLEDDRWIIPRNATRYINHSCDPNCTIDDQLCVVTVRPVAAGEELTFSYVLVDRAHYERSPENFFWHERWTFDCRCGSPNCVGKVDRYLLTGEA
jgi:hypothetical protein